ncbi:MAG: ABC transporter ATP-binding protein [Halobacteriaceae archaeon]
MIRAEDISLQYPTRDENALDDLSFSVEEGEVLGVVGPVESGKTSLAMALAGLAPQVTGGALTGDLTVAGRDPREADSDGRVGMVFEDYSAQLTQVRVIDEVLVPLLDRGFDREAALQRARELLERVRLSGYEQRRTWELSGGEQQRVAIAAVMATDPEVLVFDTATDMLDPEGREDVSNLVASLAGETTMVVTVDDPQELVGVADSVLVLEDGRAEAVGQADQILRRHDLFERVGVRPPLPLRVGRELDLQATPLSADELAAALPGAGRGGQSSEAATTVGSDDLRADGVGDPVIEVDDVTFGYDDETAVDGVDMTVHEGEVHAVVGGNGAGKTTLCELLVGLHAPDDGRLVVDGEPAADRTAADLGESIALAFQNPDEQLSRRTVEAELRFPLEQRQYDRSGWLPFASEQRYDEAYVEEHVERALSLTGLDGAGVREADPTTLPQGTRRLVAIGAALAPDPAAAVLDEPTAGLDADGDERMRQTIERLRAAGTAVIIVEHDMDFVCEMADTVTLLDDGQVRFQGPPRELFARENWDELRERYLRPPRAARLADRLELDALTADQLIESARSLAEAAT